jgi:hypothetical protein
MLVPIFIFEKIKRESSKLFRTIIPFKFLAQLGEYKQTFPIFATALSSEDNYEIHLAVVGSVEIEEAMQLIRNLPPKKNRQIPREPLINFNLKDIKKGDKL